MRVIGQQGRLKARGDQRGESDHDNAPERGTMSLQLGSHHAGVHALDFHQVPPYYWLDRSAITKRETSEADDAIVTQALGGFGP